MSRNVSLTLTDLQAQLRALELERALALASPLAADAAYMQDLIDELACMRRAYTCAAVSAIARLRESLDGPLAG
jgi:hypothetical protein